MLPGLASRVVGAVLNALLIWASILYGCVIGCFLPCLRGTAAHTINQQLRAVQQPQVFDAEEGAYYSYASASAAGGYGSGAVGTNASGGGTCQWFDPLFWS